MFSIRRDIGPFGQCELVDASSGACVRIAPGRGGIVTHFNLDGRELLYLDEPSFLDPTRSVRGGIPVLFPICANLPGDTYTIGSTVYKLKQHGLARLLSWRVVEESTVGAAGLTLELTSGDGTLPSYPFEFTLRFNYLLEGGRLTIRQEYSNRSATPMPMYSGFHPYFVCSDKQTLRFELPASRYIDQVSKASGTFSGFPFTAPTIDWIFTDVFAQEASVVNPTDGYRLTLRYDPVFKYLVFWTLADQPFYCLEPWMAPRNALNTGTDLQWVGPGERLRAEISLLAEPI